MKNNHAIGPITPTAIKAHNKAAMHIASIYVSAIEGAAREFSAGKTVEEALHWRPLAAKRLAQWELSQTYLATLAGDRRIKFNAQCVRLRATRLIQDMLSRKPSNVANALKRIREHQEALRKADEAKDHAAQVAANAQLGDFLAAHR